MQHEKIYSIFGQMLAFAVLGLMFCSVYWTLHGLIGLSAPLLGQTGSLFLGLAGIPFLLVIARRSVSLALVVSLLIAGVDRAYYRGADYPLANSVIAGLCFVIAAVMLIGVLSERMKFANKALPKVLMVVLGLAFLLPAGLIAKVLTMLRILPQRSDSE